MVSSVCAGIKEAFLPRSEPGGETSVNSAEITGAGALLWYYYRITRLSQLILPRTIYQQREGKKEIKRRTSPIIYYKNMAEDPAILKFAPNPPFSMVFTSNVNCPCDKLRVF